MYFVEPKAVLVKGLAPIDKIERAYRMCYKSEDKIKDGSYAFITKILNSTGTKCHTSPLGHVWVEIEIPVSMYEIILVMCSHEKEMWNMEPFFKTEGFIAGRKSVYITTNFRALYTLINCIDNNHHYNEVKSLAAACNNLCPAVFHKTYEDYNDGGVTIYDVDDYDFYTFRVITTRDILQEIARHTSFCLSVESTRYCNYKGGLVFTLPRGVKEFDNIDQYLVEIHPKGLKEMPTTKYELIAAQDEITMARVISNTHPTNMFEIYVDNCIVAEEMYQRALEHSKPQIARMLLPGSLKTDMYITASKEAWENFLTLRLDNAAHPQIQHLAKQIQTQIKEG